MTRTIAAALALTFLAAPLCRADHPIEFDARRVFPCREVKPPEHADANRKVIVVVIPISAEFHVQEATVESLRYEFELPSSVTILDHLPRSQTGTNEGIRHEHRQEHEIADLNVKFGGRGSIGFSGFGADVKLGAGGERDKREFKEVKTDIRVDRLPARNQIVVVGTRKEGQVLYFDLKWHDQMTRDGQTDYVLLAQVPMDWKGGCATLTCRATQDGQTVALMSKIIGLYPSGDDAARERVEREARTTHAPADDPFLQRYSGKYRVTIKDQYDTAEYTIHMHLRPDGTWSGTLESLFTSGTHRGTWSATSQELIIASKHHRTTFLGITEDADSYREYVHSKIVCFDPVERVIVTESRRLVGE